MHILTGQTFGRLRVMESAGSRKGKKYWLCFCQCGQSVTVPTWKLRLGHTKSCGCLAQETRGKAQITHGETRGPRNQWSPRTKMLYAAKARATKCSLPFNLTLDDIQVPDICPVLGISLAKNSNHCQPNSPSLDKITPELGYVKGNVRVISHKANTIKNNATVEELKKVLDYLESNQG
jgi:hypothetical protein